MTFHDPTRPMIPLNILPDELMTVAEAAICVNRSEKTIRRWIAAHGIARQSMPNSPHQISRIALEMVVCGDWPALERLKAGDRDHRLVRFYREFVGLSCE